MIPSDEQYYRDLEKALALNAEKLRAFTADPIEPYYHPRTRCLACGLPIIPSETHLCTP